LAKPKRKHPVFRIVEPSLQQQHFVDTIRSALGGLRYQPLELLSASRAHVFLLHGERGWGLFVEPVGEREQGGIWRQRYGFLQIEPASPRLHAEFLSRSWDPWTEAQETGDESLTAGPRKQLYAARNERNRVLAQDDEVTVDWLAGAQQPGCVAGIAVADIAGLVEKHRLRDLFELPSPPL
jgi:hypothetical protein